MKWNEKTRRLLDGRSPAEFARTVKINVSTFCDALRYGSIPSSTSGITIAHGLRASAEWLFDDKQGWPPPQIEKVPRTIIDDILTRLDAMHIDIADLKRANKERSSVAKLKKRVAAGKKVKKRRKAG